MKIGISVRGLNITSGGAKEMIKAITQNIVEQEKENQIFIFGTEAKDPDLFKGNNVTYVHIKSRPNLIWDHVLLPLQLRKHKIDVCLIYKNIKPLFCPCKTVTFVMDMAYFMPGLKAYKFLDTLYTKWMLPKSVRSSSKVLAISQNTRDDIYRLIANVQQEKVEVVYLDGAYKQDKSRSSEVDVRQKYNIPKDKPYIFLSSSLSPRKNIERAITALGRIKDQIPHNFVITGGKSWGNNSVNKLISELGLENRFFRLGFVEDEDLSQVFKEADVYFHPSLYEGFGMTLIEAMHAGTVVVASQTSSHPEVIGDAGLMFDPYNVEDMSKVLLNLINNPELKKELIKKGFENVKRFGWDKTANQALEIIKQVNASNN